MTRLKSLLGRGYTLVEMLVVVVIIGILMAVATGVYLRVQQNSADQLPKAHLLTAWRSAQQSAADNGSTTGTQTTRENTYPTPTSSLLSEMVTQTPTLKVLTTTDTSGVTDSSAVYVDTTASNATTTVLYATTSNHRLWEIVAHPGEPTAALHALSDLVKVAPADDYLPTISGVAIQAGTLTVDRGAWASDTHPVYSYQWRRCDAAGASCANITGATATSYSPVAGDVGSTIRVVVTATNTHGATSATSAQTKTVLAVANPGPTAAVLPSISGLAQELQTLTAKPGNWTGSPPITLAYQWLRCNTSGASCVSISGQTGLTYTVTATDVGSTLRFQVSATDANGTNIAQSTQTATVTPAPPSNTAAPAVSGTAQDEQTLTTTNGTWIGASITYSYQWLRCDTSGASCSAITGATTSSYLLTPSDVGATIRSRVTATNITGTTSANSAQTATVTPAGPANTALPVISGTARVGQSLTSSTGSWTGTPTITYSYQWESCNTSGASCVNISGATSSTYLLAASDANTTLRVAVRATNSGGNSTATSNATAVVPPAAGTVTISGTQVVGQTLTANVSGWSGVVSYAYQWEHCDSAGNNCTNISGATASTYALVAGDVGYTIRVAVTATNTGGSTAVTSAQTALISYGFPAGTMLAYAGASIPSGWALTDGSCGYTSASYPDLWAAIGTTYGGTGSSNFCLPDLRGRFPLGKAASGTGSTLGSSGGNSLGSSGSLSLPSASFTYSWSEYPAAPGFASHSHSWNGPWGSVSVKSGPCQYCDNEPYAPVNYYSATESGSVSGISASTTSSTITPTASVSYGSPPFMAVRYIIATSLTAGANAPCGGLLASASASVPSGALAADGTSASGCLDAGYGGYLPDLRNRFPVGQAQSGTASTLGSSGGALTQTHTLTLPNQSATVSKSYTATVTVSSPAHSDAESRGSAGDNSSCGCYTSNPWGGSSPMSHGGGSDNGGAYTSSTFTASGSTSAVGGQSQTATSQSPWLALKWIGYNSANYAPAAGVITAYAGSSAPSGWLVADGTCYSTATYASLFSAIGYTFGGSGGSFCVPDLRGRLPLGAGTNAIGASGGALNATPSATFSGFTPQFTVPAHTFSWSIPSHQHNDAMYKDYTCCDMSTDSANMSGIQQWAGTYTWNYAWTSANGGQTVSSSVGAQTLNPSAGYGAQTVSLPAINPPFLAVTYIIKT